MPIPGVYNYSVFAASRVCFNYRALWLNIPGLFIVVTICTLDGMVIFATYADCDLKADKKITRGDQVKISDRRPAGFKISTMGKSLGVRGPSPFFP